MKSLKKTLRNAVSKASKLSLAILMGVSGFGTTLLSANQIMQAAAVEFYNEGNLTMNKSSLSINLSDCGVNKIGYFYNMDIDGKAGFCMDAGQHSTEAKYARISSVSGTVYNSIYNWFVAGASYGDSDLMRAMAQGMVWAASEGVNDTNAAKIINKVRTANGYSALSEADAINSWHTSKSYSSSGTLYIYSYGTSGYQRILSMSSGHRPTFEDGHVSKSSTKSGVLSNKVQVHKTDAEKGTNLQGVRFDFYRDGTKIGSTTTNSSGVASVTYSKTITKTAKSNEHYYIEGDLSNPNEDKIPDGYYSSESAAAAAAQAQADSRAQAAVNAEINTTHSFYAIETATRTKYYLNPDNDQTSTVNKTGSGDVSLTLKNTRQKGTINLTKTDVETGNGVKGATYKLYANETISHPDGKTGVLYKKGDLVATFPATDNNGQSKLTNLYHGSYYIQESTASDKYVLDINKYYVTINVESTDVSVVTKSSEVSELAVRGSILLQKEDKNLNEGTDDATIVDANNDGAQGDATKENAVYGLYAKSSIVHPDNHVGVVTYNQNADSIYEITLEKGTDLNVVDNPANEGALLATAKTDDNGEIQFSHLFLGEYYIKELTPSEGYLLDEETHDVTLSYEGQNVPVVSKTVTSLEQVKKQGFEIVKLGHQVGMSGVATPLKDVEFTIKLESDVQNMGWDDAPVYDVERTDNTGHLVTIDLPYGTYRVRETKGAKDYNLSEDFFVTISEDSRTPQTPYEANTYIVEEGYTSLLKVQKVDNDSGKNIVVSGTEFKVKAVSDVRVGDTLFTPGEYIGYWEKGLFPHYVDSWTTNDEGYIILQEKLSAGEYELEEIHAAKPYVLGIVQSDGTVSNENTPFTITTEAEHEKFDDDKNDITYVTIKDTPVKGRINVYKEGEVLTGYENGEFIYEVKGLAGAEYQIIAAEDIVDPCGDGTVLYEKGTVVTTLTTGDDGHGQSDLLYLGKYTVQETKAPHGYVLNQVPQDVELVYENENVPVVFDDANFQNERQKVSIETDKKDSETGTYLEGAEFTIYAENAIYNYMGEEIVADGTALQSITTNEEGKAVFTLDLPNDYNYIVKETKQPVGYASSSEVLTYSPRYVDQTQSIVSLLQDFENDITKVSISKKMITGDDELENCLLSVYPVVDGTIQMGEAYDTWYSSNTPHLIKGLEVEKEYALVEKTPADGYTTANTIYFTIKDTGEIQTVTMINELTEVRIHKQDDDSHYVEGATLAIYPVDENGEPIIGETFATFTTPADGYYTVKGLTVGQKYMIRETAAPFEKGYTTMDDYEFTVDDSLEGQDIYLKDGFTHIAISKTETNNPDKFVKDAVLALYPIDENDEPILGMCFETWMTGDEAHLIDRIPTGRYLLRELSTPADTGYIHAEDMIIEVKDTSDLQEFTMADDYTKVEISKQDIVSGEEIPNAHLQVTDDENDNEIVVEWITDGTPKLFENVFKPNHDYTLTETAVDYKGYIINTESVHFHVDETGTIQRVTMKDDYTKVEISKQDITNGKELSDARLQIIDKETGKIIVDFVTDGNRTMFENVLKPNHDYILREITAPDGYRKTEDVEFTVEETGEIQTVIMYDSKAKSVKVKTDDTYDATLFAGLAVASALGALAAAKKKKED